jgi:hypothetical protein
MVAIPLAGTMSFLPVKTLVIPRDDAANPRWEWSRSGPAPVLSSEPQIAV